MTKSSSSDLRKATAQIRRCRLVVVTAAKGGVGKTTFARNLLISAAREGLRAVGVCMDPQRSLWGWGQARLQLRRENPELASVDVWEEALDNWQDVLSRLDGYDICVVDCPPGSLQYEAQIKSLVERADFALLPTAAYDDDLINVVPWGKALSGINPNICFALNRVVEQARSTKIAQTALSKAFTMVPVPIPSFEIVADGAREGWALMDKTEDMVSARERASLRKAQELFNVLWAVTRREVGL